MITLSLKCRCQLGCRFGLLSRGSKRILRTHSEKLLTWDFAGKTAPGATSFSSSISGHHDWGLEFKEEGESVANTMKALWDRVRLLIAIMRMAIAIAMASDDGPAIANDP